jgi:UDP-N-acetylglucosamine 2-epimerase (non-hydrolysing)
MTLPRILVVFGTRPEAIKMFPVVHALQATASLSTLVAVTAQHRGMLDQVLDIASIVPDVDLDLMEPGQSLDALAARILTSFGEALDRLKPDRVLVHGDTLTTMMVTLAAYFRRIPVGHVEAGLRSGNIYSPWPEEVNRKVAGAVADLHFAPTQGAADALRAENIAAGTIHVTGNTVIDALLATRERVAQRPSLATGLDTLAARFAGKRIIGVTSHRRENFGQGMANIAKAIGRIADRPDTAVIFPVHPNPQVRSVMEAQLASHPSVALIEPLDYPHFVRLMDMADLILTDSGGVQEEAPSLGKPVLVMRDTTERPEGIAAGTARLVATDTDRIVAETARLLDDRTAYLAMAQAHNPYGDGYAATRIAQIIAGVHCG